MKPVAWASSTALALVFALGNQSAFAQSFGIELHNTLMPASGGMAGVSISQPQDPVSALNANPAALTQFQGTQFSFGGAWAEGQFDLTQTGNLAVPGITPFSASSGFPGVALGNIGVTQSFASLGLPVTTGLALISNAGAGVDFRGIAASNGTSSQIVDLQFTAGAGADLTENLSAGATISMGQAFFDGPFVGIGAMVMSYGLRGAVGINYKCGDCTSAGIYYQTKENFVFEDAIRLELLNGQFETTRDIHMDMPDNIGFGIANKSLMDGRLLLAADVLFKEWDNADLFKDVYHNQWVIQLGSQYSVDRCRYRLGYAWAENPLATIDDITVDGIPLPGATAAVNYLQAQLAIINEHRLTAGVGVVDVLPGVDFDMFAGFMFSAREQLGDFTSVDVSSYWLGMGLTWRFGGAVKPMCCDCPSVACTPCPSP